MLLAFPSLQEDSTRESRLEGHFWSSKHMQKPPRNGSLGSVQHEGATSSPLLSDRSMDSSVRSIALVSGSRMGSGLISRYVAKSSLSSCRMAAVRRDSGVICKIEALIVEQEDHVWVAVMLMATTRLNK